MRVLILKFLVGTALVAGFSFVTPQQKSFQATYGEVIQFSDPGPGLG